MVAGDVLTPFSNCSFVFRGDSKDNSIVGLFNQQPVFIAALEQCASVVNVYIEIAERVSCEHYKHGKRNHKVESDSDTHLTYHGGAKGKKMSGQTHLRLQENLIMKGRTHDLEAPLAVSSNIKFFPVPICRLELSDHPSVIIRRPSGMNYAELYGPNCYFNTVEFYLASKGFIRHLLSGHTQSHEVFASLFAFTTLETFMHGRIIRRVGYYPQVLSVQNCEYELVIIAMKEYKNESYKSDRLIYFRSKDYFKNLCERSVMSTRGGFFVSSTTSDVVDSANFASLHDLL